MTFSTLRGLGYSDCSTGECEEIPDDPPPSSPVIFAGAGGGSGAGSAFPSMANNAGIQQQQYNSQFPQGNASTGFNWGGFFSGIIPTLANDATKLGQQAIASPGTVIGPSGQVITGGGMQSGVSSNAAQSITAMMPVILLGVGGLLLIMVMKGRR